MKRYETISIIDPDISEEARAQFLDRIQDIITQRDGYIAKLELWGMKKLTYEIRKKTRGYYVLFDFCGTGNIVDEMERIFRIDDRCIKFMTILLADNVTIEGVKEEIAQKEAAQRAKAAEKAAQEAQASLEDFDDSSDTSNNPSDNDDEEE
jgi:small subunit ribosomal protein S6